MIDDNLNQLLDHAGQFSDDFKSSLRQMLNLEFYKPKQIIHAAGQIEMNLYLIDKGFARSYYYDRKGIDHTVRFWSEGDLVFSYEGYYKVPSFYYTEFMEASSAVALGYADFSDLQRKFPESSALIKYALLKNRKEEYERQSILTLPANERYERLLEHNHKVFQKSSAKYIASYLNMTRETLARLMGKR